MSTGVYYDVNYDRALFCPGSCVNGKLDPTLLPGCVVSNGSLGYEQGVRKRRAGFMVRLCGVNSAVPRSDFLCVRRVWKPSQGSGEVNDGERQDWIKAGSCGNHLEAVIQSQVEDLW